MAQQGGQLLGQEMPQCEVLRWAELEKKPIAGISLAEAVATLHPLLAMLSEQCTNLASSVATW